MPPTRSSDDSRDTIGGGSEIERLEGRETHSPGRSISVVIPSWNGLHLLEDNLPAVKEAVDHYRSRTGAETEIIVVDDGSTDGTAAALEREHSDICVVVRPQNGGFAAACNSGFEVCRHELVALLNNDVRIAPDYLFFKSLHFDQANVFAVTARVFDWDRPIFATGGRYARFRRGFWSVYFNYDVDNEGGEEWIERCRLLSFYAIGGFATYARVKLQELGGFDELLSPFHWEDVDLSYRGWKRGWEVHYEPRSRARHRASSTIDAHFKKKDVDAVSFRNRLLFHWINLHSTGYLSAHIVGLTFMGLTKVLVLDRYFYRSLFQALGLVRRVRVRRRAERHCVEVGDREISSRLNDFYRNAPIRIYYNQKQVIESHPECS